MINILIIVLLICIPTVITIVTGSGKKRGCGGGCAACGNRKTCHREK